MPIVVCSECSGQVSTTLNSCPHCGFVLSESQSPESSGGDIGEGKHAKATRSRSRSPFSILIGLVCIGVLIVLLLLSVFPQAIEEIFSGFRDAAVKSKASSEPRPPPTKKPVVSEQNARPTPVKSNTADSHFERGRAYLKKGDNDQAIKSYSEAIRLKPQVADYYQYRGSAYYHKAAYSQAIVDFSEAIRLRPKSDYKLPPKDKTKNASYYNWRGMAYLNRWGEKVDKGDVVLAIVDFSAAIRLDPDTATYYTNRGYAYEAMGEKGLAFGDFRRGKGGGERSNFWVDIFRSKNSPKKINGPTEKALPNVRALQKETPAPVKKRKITEEGINTVNELRGQFKVDQNQMVIAVMLPILAEISADQLVSLKRLPELRGLGLQGTNIKDAGLKQIGEMEKLEVLDLAVTYISDDGLAHLKGLKRLKMLDLHGTGITDAGLRHLRYMTSLEALNLNQTKGVTDFGLNYLKGLRKLKRIDLGFTKTTEAGINNLKQALPNCVFEQ